MYSAIDRRLESLSTEMRLAVHAIITLGCLGFVVWAIWNLPLWQLFQLAFWLAVFPMMFAVAVGWVGRDALWGVMQLSKMTRDGAKKAASAAKDVMDAEEVD